MPDVVQTTTASPTDGGPPPFNAVPEVDVDASTEVGTTESHAADEVATRAQESEARRGGWINQDEWIAEGRDPDRWRPADKFLEIRHTSDLRREEKLSAALAKVAALEARERERERKTAEAQTNLTIGEIELKMQQAQENGDWSAFAKLNRELVKAELGAQRVAAQPAAPSIDEQSKADALQFRSENPWLMKDKQLARNFAVELKAITDIDPSIGAAEALNDAKQRVMRLFPERFRTNNGRRPPMYETPGSTTIGNGNGRTWADLKPAYRGQAEADIQAKKYTKEEFLAASQDDPDAWRR
jgi:hypothetical protein